MKLIFASY